MHSGVVNGVLNEIDGTISQYKEKYQDLTVILTGGDAKMLSKQLKEMENDTLVKRKVVKSNPITVEYSLTQFGNSSLPIIRSLVKWGSINKKKMSRVIEKDQERVIDLLHDEIRFKNLQRKNFYG